MTPIHEKVLKAARRVFAAHGYNDTSMLAIAEQARIAVGGLYKFYPSKLELFQAVYQLENQASKERIVTRIDWSRPKEAIHAYVQATVRAVRRSKILGEWYSDIPGEILRQTYREELKKSPKQGCVILGDFFAERIAEWRTAGLLRAEATDRIIGEWFIAVASVDATADISPKTMQFMIAAMVDALFVE